MKRILILILFIFILVGCEKEVVIDYEVTPLEFKTYKTNIKYDTLLFTNKNDYVYSNRFSIGSNKELVAKDLESISFKDGVTDFLDIKVDFMSSMLTDDKWTLSNPNVRFLTSFYLKVKQKKDLEQPIEINEIFFNIRGIDYTLDVLIRFEEDIYNLATNVLPTQQSLRLFVYSDFNEKFYFSVLDQPVRIKKTYFKRSNQPVETWWETFLSKEKKLEDEGIIIKPAYKGDRISGRGFYEYSESNEFISNDYLMIEYEVLNLFDEVISKETVAINTLILTQLNQFGEGVIFS